MRIWLAAATALALAILPARAEDLTLPVAAETLGATAGFFDMAVAGFGYPAAGDAAARIDSLHDAFATLATQRAARGETFSAYPGSGQLERAVYWCGAQEGRALVRANAARLDAAPGDPAMAARLLLLGACLDRLRDGTTIADAAAPAPAQPDATPPDHPAADPAPTDPAPAPGASPAAGDDAEIVRLAVMADKTLDRLGYPFDDQLDDSARADRMRRIHVALAAGAQLSGYSFPLLMKPRDLEAAVYACVLERAERTLAEDTETLRDNLTALAPAMAARSTVLTACLALFGDARANDPAAVAHDAVSEAALAWEAAAAGAGYPTDAAANEMQRLHLLHMEFRIGVTAALVSWTNAFSPHLADDPDGLERAVYRCAALWLPEPAVEADKLASALPYLHERTVGGEAIALPAGFSADRTAYMASCAMSFLDHSPRWTEPGIFPPVTQWEPPADAAPAAAEPAAAAPAEESPAAADPAGPDATPPEGAAHMRAEPYMALPPPEDGAALDDRVNVLAARTDRLLEGFGYAADGAMDDSGRARRMRRFYLDYYAGLVRNGAFFDPMLSPQQLEYYVFSCAPQLAPWALNADASLMRDDIADGLDAPAAARRALMRACLGYHYDFVASPSAEVRTGEIRDLALAWLETAAGLGEPLEEGSEAERLRTVHMEFRGAVALALSLGDVALSHFRLNQARLEYQTYRCADGLTHMPELSGRNRRLAAEGVRERTWDDRPVSLPAGFSDRRATALAICILTLSDDSDRWNDPAFFGIEEPEPASATPADHPPTLAAPADWTAYSDADFDAMIGEIAVSIDAMADAAGLPWPGAPASDAERVQRLRALYAFARTVSDNEGIVFFAADLPLEIEYFTFACIREGGSRMLAVQADGLDRQFPGSTLGRAYIARLGLFKMCLNRLEDRRAVIGGIDDALTDLAASWESAAAAAGYGRTDGFTAADRRLALHLEFRDAVADARRHRQTFQRYLSYPEALEADAFRCAAQQVADATAGPPPAVGLPELNPLGDPRVRPASYSEQRAGILARCLATLQDAPPKTSASPGATAR